MKTDKTGQIKTLYLAVNKKTQFISELATALKKSPRATRNNWFGGFWLIPIDHQPAVIKMLEKTIKRQEKTKAA